jgi:hypothetical protein
MKKKMVFMLLKNFFQFSKNYLTLKKMFLNVLFVGNLFYNNKKLDLLFVIMFFMKTVFNNGLNKNKLALIVTKICINLF